MAARSRMRPAHWIVLALVLAPVWKVVEPFLRTGPKAVSAEAVAGGRLLFNHEWTANDPLAKGDGLGPVFKATRIGSRSLPSTWTYLGSGTASSLHRWVIMAATFSG